MSGRYALPLEFDPQSPIAGIASVDCDTRKILVLLGYFPFGSIPAHRPDVKQVPIGPPRNITVSLASIPACAFPGSLARVLVEIIPGTGFDAMLAPTILRNQLVHLSLAEPLALTVQMAPLSAAAITLASVV